MDDLLKRAGGRQSLRARESHHMLRPRLTALMKQAAGSPLVIVCASAGYGKTWAVSDFAVEHDVPTAWIQLSERDNFAPRFWENLVNSIAPLNAVNPKEYLKLGFPDTADKLDRYIRIRNRAVANREYVLVFDDIHLISDAAVLRYFERSIHAMPENVTVFLLCREYPKVNVVDLDINGLVFNISEDDLNFTYDELFQYARRQELDIDSRMLAEILEDTNGWAFAVSLVMRSLKKSPGYVGYVQTAMRQNIFKLMKSEAWDTNSERLRHFLVRLSLVNHLSADLVADLAGGDRDLLPELERQNAYIRLDGFINTYMIHHLFLDFLCAKRDILSADEVSETYKKAADWCNKNDFKMDALSYYEKIGDYDAIVSILNHFPGQIPHDIALYSRKIFENAPEDTFLTVEFFAVSHLRTLLNLGLCHETIALAKEYERRLLSLPEDAVFYRQVLACVYIVLGKARMLAGIEDHRYDFDTYYKRMDELLSQFPLAPHKVVDFLMGPWVSMAGDATQGAPQAFCEALSRTVLYVSHGLDQRLAGLDDLGRGELEFYQGNIHTAEALILQALTHARSHEQYEMMHRALLYLIRIAVSQGHYKKAEQSLAELKGGVGQFRLEPYANLTQIAAGWYYYLVHQPQMVPGWLKDKFTPYVHTVFIENFGNQVKARYCYLTKNYPPLLAYIQEVKQRESVLFGRIEMLALEACIRFQMKEKVAAFSALQAAYEAAVPNGLLMPFIELGKDMRTLTSAAVKDAACQIPHAWLLNINRKSTTYAKHQSQVIVDYRRANSVDNDAPLSALELRILRDLVEGLSRLEIAANQKLSVNTVNSVVTSIYTKLNAHNVVDAVRIVIEQKLL